MEQLELLWQYQLVDIEVDRCEREMRQDPDRVKLLKHRDFLVEQQNVVKRIETEVAVMSDRMAAIADEVVRLREALNDMMRGIEANPPADIEEVQRLSASAQKLMGTITRYEQELAKLRKDADARDRQQHEVRVRAAKIKAEFDQLKAKYDAAYKQQALALEKLKAKSSKAAEGIEPAMLEKYNTIKRHSMPPIAKMNDERCGGCNMSLPSVVLNKIRTGSAAVECENCGRIILVQK